MRAVFLMSVVIFWQLLWAQSTVPAKRLFRIPYGREPHQILLEPFGYRYPAEGSTSTGPKKLRVSSDGNYFYIITETKHGREILQIFNRQGILQAHIPADSGFFFIARNGMVCWIGGDATSIEAVERFRVRLLDVKGKEPEHLKPIARAYEKGIQSLVRSGYSIHIIYFDSYMNLYFSGVVLDDNKYLIGKIDKYGSASFLIYNRSFADFFSESNEDTLIYFQDALSESERKSLEEAVKEEHAPPGASIEVFKVEVHKFYKINISVFSMKDKKIIRRITIPNEKSLDKMEAESESPDLRKVRADRRGNLFVPLEPLKIHWQAIETPYGEFAVKQVPIQEYAPDGKRIGLRAVIPIADYGGPGGPVEPWDVDAPGNLYYLVWTKDALEVWLAPVPESGR